MTAVRTVPTDGFATTSRERRALTVQHAARLLFLLVALLLLAPVLCILAVLVVEGAPGLSFDFFLTKPRDNGAAGGIATALVGTIWRKFEKLQRVKGNL